MSTQAICLHVNTSTLFKGSSMKHGRQGIDHPPWLTGQGTDYKEPIFQEVI